MRFDYQMYLRSDLYVPFALLVASLAFIGKCVFHFVRYYRQGGWDQMFGMINGVLFAIMFTSMVIRGFPLLKDKSQKCDNVEGKVESIEIVTFGTRHNVYNDVRMSVYITVNGEKFYSASLPEISAGNQVTLYILENSRFVIGYERVD